MPIERYGSGNPGWGNEEDDPRASSLSSQQEQQVWQIFNHGVRDPNAIASYLGSQVNPQAVSEYLRQQRVGPQQESSSSSSGPTSSYDPWAGFSASIGRPTRDASQAPTPGPSSTSRYPTPVFDPHSPYADPGAPPRYPSSEPQTPGFPADDWSAYGDPGAPRYQSSEPATPRSSRAPQTPLFLPSLQSPTPGPSTPRPSSSRQPSLPPAPGGYSSSTPTPRGGRSSTRPSQPPHSSSSMPPPPIFQPQPRFDPYPPGSSRFGGGSLSGAIPTPDLNAMRQQMAAPPGSPQEGFTTEGLPPGWAANPQDNLLRSPGRTEYQISQQRKKPSRTEQQAFSRLLNDISSTPGLSNARASKAFGKNTKFLSGKSRSLPPNLQQAKKSLAESGRLGGLASQVKRTPEQRKEWGARGATARAAIRYPAENAPNISERVLRRYHQQNMSIAAIARQLRVRETFVSNIIWDTVDEEQPPSD